MTCIVGYFDEENETAWMGGDGLGSNNYEKFAYKQAKVFKDKTLNSVMIGATTSYRHLDLLRYSDLFDAVDVYKAPEIDHEYMVTKFIPRVISLFNEKVMHEKNEEKGGNFVVCTSKRIFEVQSDYSVLEPILPFCAVGSGRYFAIASLYETRELNISPMEKVKRALEAAEQFNGGVERPFTIINTATDESRIIH